MRRQNGFQVLTLGEEVEIKEKEINECNQVANRDTITKKGTALRCMTIGRMYLPRHSSSLVILCCRGAGRKRLSGPSWETWR